MKLKDLMEDKETDTITRRLKNINTGKVSNIRTVYDAEEGKDVVFFSYIPPSSFRAAFRSLPGPTRSSCRRRSFPRCGLHA